MGGDLLHPAERFPKPFSVSVALDRVRTVSTKWGLTGLTTGIKTTPSVLAFYEVTLLMGSLRADQLIFLETYFPEVTD